MEAPRLVKRKSWVTASCIVLIILALVLKIFPTKGALYTYWEVPGLSKPYDITTDGRNIWFTEYHSGEIGKFDPEERKFWEYALSPLARLQGISYDGHNIWYVDSLRSKAGYAKAPSPVNFYEFQLPDDSEPWDIAPYNYTLVWITLLGNRSIALLNVSDTDNPSLTIFSLPERNGEPAPRSIIFVEGSGCWYVDSGRGVIGQIPLYSNKTLIEDLGLIREWTLIEGREPWDLAADTYGRIWFTDPSNSLIGMLNPASNEVAEFEVPGSGARPYGITVDDMNNVWFTDSVRGSLWRYSQDSGTFTEFKLPDAVTPQYITASLSDYGRGREVGEPGPPVYGIFPLWIVDFEGNLIISFDPKEQPKTTVYVTELPQASPVTSYVERFTSNSSSPEKANLEMFTTRIASNREEATSTLYSILETVSIVRTSTLHMVTVTETETVVFTTNSTTTAVSTIIGATVTGGTTTLTLTETLTSTSYVTTVTETLTLTTTLITWNATAQIIPWSTPPSIALGIALGGLILALAVRLRSRGRTPIRGKLGRRFRTLTLNRRAASA